MREVEVEWYLSERYWITGDKYEVQYTKQSDRATNRQVHMTDILIDHGKSLRIIKQCSLSAGSLKLFPIKL